MSVPEFPVILSSDDQTRTWALCLCKFSIGIPTENFMTERQGVGIVMSGILLDLSIATVDTWGFLTKE